MFCFRNLTILIPFFTLILAFQRPCMYTALAFASTRFPPRIHPTTGSILHHHIFPSNSHLPNSDLGMSAPRRSARLRALHSSKDSPQDERIDDGDTDNQRQVNKPQVSSKKQKKTEVNETKAKPATPLQDHLPRTLESKLMNEMTSLRFVMGIDEAGRGPLAGPVVAAAAIVPVNIAGIVDSKKITKEATREQLYDEIVSSPGVRWAAAVVDAPRIDEINILQATLLAMRMAAAAVMAEEPIDRIDTACVSKAGCYVVCGQMNLSEKFDFATERRQALGSDAVYALIDGNRIPKDMPCQAEFIIKGDGKEFSIAAASIIAKVTRDRLMNAYDKLYPAFGLQQHKGYGTAKHMAAIHKFGASPIHRLTFAPLKHMQFDDDGNVVDDS
jgi:ribonuclease HII